MKLIKPFYDVETPAPLAPPHVHPFGEPAAPWARDPYRPTPNPATGELTVDPEISLRAKGVELDISLYYNTNSSENYAYGQSRTISLESYVVSNMGADSPGTGLSLVRGDGQVYGFTGQPGNYQPIAAQNSGTTIAYDATHNKFTEYFPGGIRCVYQNQGEPQGDNGFRHDLIQVVNPASLTTTYVYATSGSQLGLLQTVQVPSGQIVSLLYSASTVTSLISAIQDWGNRRWTFTFDAARNMTQFETPLGCLTQYAYAKFTAPNATLLYSIEDPRGYLTYYGYDSKSRVATMVYGAATTSYQYGTDVGLDGSVRTDPTGAKTTYTIDGSGRIYTTARPEGYIVTNGYDANGFLTSALTPAGFLTSLVYNSNGLVSVSRDPLGNATTYQYSAAQDLTTVTAADGGIWSQVFDASHNILNTVDPLGRRNTLTWDGSGQMLTFQDARGLKTSFAYDTSGNIASTLFADGGVVTNSWDSYNRLIATTDQLSRTTSFGYDVGDNRVSTTDPLGNITTQIFNTCLLQAVVDPLNHRTSFTYDRFANQQTRVNALGYTTTMLADSMGYITTVTDALGNSQVATFNAAKQQIASTDALNYVTTFGFDNAGRPQSVQNARGYTTTTVYDARDAIARIDALGNRWTTVYDALDRAVASVTPLNFISTTVYDAASQVTARVDALSNRTSYLYDVAGNQTQAQDALNNLTTTVYQSTSNRPASTIDALNFRTSYVYDVASQRISRQNALGAMITMAYDLASRQISIANELGYPTTSVYDAASRLVQKQDANGKTISYSFDVANQQTGILYFDGTRVTMAFDAVGSNTTMIDWAGTTSYAFDARRSLIGKTEPGAYVQAYGYDAAQNRTTLVDPDGGVFSSTFDALDRLSALTNPSNEIFTLGYDFDSRNTTMLTGNNSSRASQFDAVGQLTTIIQYQGASPVATIVDAYDGAGWKTSHNVVTLTGGILATYTNDARGRLTGQQAAGLTATMAYDAVDNTTLKWYQGQTQITMAYDVASRLATLLDGSNTSTYLYDNNGNTKFESAHGGVTTYTFDFENRMVQARVQLGSKFSNFSYAGDTGLRRTRQGSSGSVHTIIWDGSNYLAEY